VKMKPAGAQVMMLYGIDNIGANSELMLGADSESFELITTP